MISLIIPVYNAENYIHKLLDCVKNQTCKDFECIVVNDGSTDNTLDIIYKYVQESSNIKILNNKHSGLVASIKTGVKIANNNYVCFCDADDLISKDYVRLINKALRDFPNIQGITYQTVWNERPTNNCEYDNPYTTFTNEELIAYKKDFFNGGNYQIRTNKVLTKELFNLIDKNYDPNMSYCEDLYFSCAFMFYIESYVIINTPLMKYMHRATSMTQKFSDTKQDSMNLVLQTIRNEPFCKTLYANWVSNQMGNELKALKLFYNNQLSFTSPKVSIVIPVYNRAYCVLDTLKSVVNQIDPNIECIIVDDGSTDESYNMIETYIADLPNFKLYHKPNGGLVSALKYGIERTTTSYVGFLDSDDTITEDWSLLVNKAIEQYQPDGIEFWHKTYNNIRYYGLNNDKQADELYQLFKDTDMEALQDSFYHNDFCGVRWNKIVRKDILNQICEYYDNRLNYGEDIYFAYAFYSLTQSVVQIHKQLILYNSRNDSMVHNMKYNYIESIEVLNDIIMNKTELAHNDLYANWLVSDMNDKYNEIRKQFGLPYCELINKIKEEN